MLTFELFLQCTIHFLGYDTADVEKNHSEELGIDYGFEDIVMELESSNHLGHGVNVKDVNVTIEELFVAQGYRRRKSKLCY